MRKKELLFSMEDISILYQYLYMSEDNFITIDNGMAKLEIRMDENGYLHSKNLNFPDLPNLNCTANMSISNMLSIINQLKKNSAIEYPNNFTNRWEEIKSVTLENISLNKMEKRFY